MSSTYAAYSGVKPCECAPKACSEWHERKQAACLRFMARDGKLEVKDCGKHTAGTWHKDGVCLLCASEGANK